jgi:hypothetical protein
MKFIDQESCKLTRIKLMSSRDKHTFRQTVVA